MPPKANHTSTGLGTSKMAAASPPQPAENDKDTQYRLKTKILLEKVDQIRNSNNMLRNRLYHIRKEINNLKRLKRYLWARLSSHGEISFSEFELEVPDEPEAEKAPKRRRKNETKKAVANRQEDSSTRRLSEIIDGIVTDVHDEQLEKDDQIPPTKASPSNNRIMSPTMEGRASSCESDLPQAPETD